MTPQELYRPLALVGNALIAQARTRFLGLLPESLCEGVQTHLANVGGLECGEMTIVEQVLSADLDALFGEQLEVQEEWAEVLPLRVADVLAVIAAEVLRQGQSTGILRQVLTHMYDKDPDSTGKVQNALFGFNDFAILPDRELQGQRDPS
jgi:hypothetical protein